MKNNIHREMGKNNLEEILGNRPDYQRQIGKLKPVYESLELSPFSDEILTQLIECGTEDVLNDYHKQVTAEINDSGIKGKRMKDILMQGYNDAANELNSALAELLSAVDAKRKELAGKQILSGALIMATCSFPEKQYGHSKEAGNAFKFLKIGNQSWIATTDGKSWSFEYSNVIMKPDNDDVYLYASCPANMGPAKLLVSYEPLPNTPTHYLVLIKQYDYRDIDFK